MSDLPRYLQDLDEALADLPDDADAMLLSEIDGYVAGLALLPAAVPDEEWLPAVWRPNAATPDYLYHDQALLDDIARLASQHFRMVARDLHRGEFLPIYDVDEENDDVLWEYWIQGFGRAMALQPDAFEKLDPSDEEAIDALSGLVALSMLAVGDLEREAVDGESTQAADNDDAASAEAGPMLSDEAAAALAADAPDLIPELLATLYECTRTMRPAPSFLVPVRKEQTGRNDPCPCGSGKKYKRCCGLTH